MPTISNALLRHPSFPLIVPKAEWRTPQIIKNSSGGKTNNAQNMPHQNQEFQPSKSRPRAVSLQIPFMGGTIVPSNHMNLAKKFRIRRNSVPPSNVADERYGSNHLLLLSWQISFKTLTVFSFGCYLWEHFREGVVCNSSHLVYYTNNLMEHFL